MKYKGTLTAAASGSIAGLTFSHNRGGQYIRARTIPTNPSSPFQQAVRDAAGVLTTRWGEQLTPTQRESWDNYALQVQIPDPLGEPRNIGGIAMYTRSNVSRIQAGLAIQDDAPVILNLGTFTKPTVSAFTPGDQTLEVAFNEGDSWVQEDGSALLLYGSRALSPAVNFFKGPFRLAAAILGSSSSPPTSPVVITNPFPFQAGSKTFLKSRVTRADGRLSSEGIDPESLPQVSFATWDSSLEILRIGFDRPMDTGTSILGADMQLQIDGTSWTTANASTFPSSNQFIEIDGWTSGLAAGGEFFTYTRGSSDLADTNGLLLPDQLQFPVTAI